MIKFLRNHIRAFHNLAFFEFLCSPGVLLFHFMMWNHWNFFRFLKLFLDHPHRGQRLQRSVCAPENANFFIYRVAELIFVSQDSIFQGNQFDTQEVKNPLINKKVFRKYWDLFLAHFWEICRFFAYFCRKLIKHGQVGYHFIQLTTKNKMFEKPYPF